MHPPYQCSPALLPHLQILGKTRAMEPTCHLPGCDLSKYQHSLGLSFPICKVVIIIVSSLWGGCEDQKS